MANPTTNYGWPMPTSADLVTDLPADFALFGQPVDTSLKALNPETTLGDIAYRSATSNTNTRLGIGTNGQVLAVVAGVPAWQNGTTGDIEGVTAGVGISGGGTSGTVTVTNSMATAFTTSGDLIQATGSGTFARLATGTSGQYLTTNGTTNSWASVSAGGKTIIASGSLSSTEVSITSIPGTYTALELVVSNYLPSAGGNNLQLRFNNDSTANRHSNFNVGTAATTDARNRTFDNTNCPIGMSGNSTTGQGMSDVIIPNYANATSWKMGFAYYMTNNSTTSTNMNSGFYQLAYNQTGAVTSLQIRFDGGTATGNYILYGVN